uniref:Uncharacterized protein n=1 Tax=Arundo donax TaxID=35708 RepID=A0A0A9CFG0_ARUDO
MDLSAPLLFLMTIISKHNDAILLVSLILKHVVR